jgi:UDP-N-acetylglucosamine transferase subunit ALG13
VIFVTLGTHEQPFDRALDLVSDLVEDDELLIQHGATRARPSLPRVQWRDYMDWEPLTARMRDAEVVITHAGVGSAVTAIRAGKKPVLVPRLARFGEHVDDHQLQLAQRLAEFDLAVVCGPGERLEEPVMRARADGLGSLSAHRSSLAKTVAEAALGG